MNRTAVACTTILSLSLLGAAAITAGPLDPPAGPVASTYKTLSEVEPRIAINAVNTPGDHDSVFRITQPGSYYLTADVVVLVARRGIEIAANGVTIDLNGFTVNGVARIGLEGISTAGVAHNNITVRDGFVNGVGGRGIDLMGSSHRVAGVSVRFCNDAGIVLGDNAVVESCIATDNLQGIVAGAGATITGCRAASNDATGITAQASSVVASCTASDNVTGVSVFQSSVSDCTATGNSSFGFNLTSGCTATDCVAAANGAGFLLFEGCAAIACTASSNTGIGFGVAANTPTKGSTLTGCTASSNGTDGIQVGAASLINGCTVNANLGDGIEVASRCRVVGNSCTSNRLAGVGAGIHATGSDNHIEGNTCTDNGTGVDVDAAGNVIVRNTCSGNTANNWDIANSNVCLVINAVRATNFAGNAGGVSPGSTDPSANFTY